MAGINLDIGETGPEIDGYVTIGDYRYTLYSDGHAGVRVIDTSKSSYGALQSTITYNEETYTLTAMNDYFPMIGVQGCFAECSEMTVAPEIPSSVLDMVQCFEGCTSLTTAPEMPSSVRDMSLCFDNCISLTTAPSIPSSVTNMYACFANCIALTGSIEVHGTPTSYSDCFRNTTQPITLAVSDESEIPTWREVALTSPDGNVTVIYADNNPEPTAILAVTRVAAKGDTTEYDYGQWAYVQVATIASTEQAPDNVADTPTITLDGTTATPQQASGTANYVGWLSLGDEAAHTIGATPHDSYKTGQMVTVTLVPAYSPMEFHEGGDGASFGKHAVAGKLASAWPIESDGDVKATAAGATHSLVGKQNALTAGNNVQISNDTISATDTTYSAGTGLSKSNNNVLSVTDGNPYCKSGSNVKVNGSTIGTADNLAYVSSGELFRVQNCISGTHTVPGNTGAGNTYAVTPISGYKAIGVVGFQNTSGNRTAITACYVNVAAQTIYTHTRALTSASESVADHVRVLYIRDSFTV